MTDTLAWEGANTFSSDAAVLTGGGFTWTAYSANSNYAVVPVAGSTGSRTQRRFRNQATTSVTSYYFRECLWLDAAPANEFALAWGSTSGAVNTFASIDTSRRLNLVNNSPTDTLIYSAASSSYKSQSSTNAVPLEEWVRIEGHINSSGSTLRMWTTSGAGIHSSGTPDVEVTTSGSGGTFTSINVGAMNYDGAAINDLYSGIYYLYTDEWAVGTSGWIGSATPVAPSGTSFAGIVPI